MNRTRRSTGQCWERNPKIQKFLEEEGLENTTQLEHFYIQKLEGILADLFAPSKLRKV
jgi:N-acetyl-beta-hexosaminidase